MHRLVLAILAAYRISSLISSEEGPYLGWPTSDQQLGLLEMIRVRLGAYDLAENGLAETNIGRGISCPLCVGIYVSLLVTGLALYKSKWSTLILFWFAVAGGQTLLEDK